MIRRSGWSLMELIIVMVIAGIIYGALVNSASHVRSELNKSRLLDKIKNATHTLCSGYMVNAKQVNDLQNYEYFTSQLGPNHPDYTQSMQNPNFEKVFTDVEINKYLPRRAQTLDQYGVGFNGDKIIFSYKNGKCYAEFEVDDKVFDDFRDITSHANANVTVGSVRGSFKVVLETTSENVVQTDKKLLFTRNIVYKDRKRKGTFNSDINDPVLNGTNITLDQTMHEDTLRNDYLYGSEFGTGNEYDHRNYYRLSDGSDWAYDKGNAVAVGQIFGYDEEVNSLNEAGVGGIVNNGYLQDTDIVNGVDDRGHLRISQVGINDIGKVGKEDLQIPTNP